MSSNEFPSDLTMQLIKTMHNATSHNYCHKTLIIFIVQKKAACLHANCSLTTTSVGYLCTLLWDLNHSTHSVLFHTYMYIHLQTSSPSLIFPSMPECIRAGITQFVWPGSVIPALIHSGIDGKMRETSIPGSYPVLYHACIIITVGVLGQSSTQGTCSMALLHCWQ